VDFKHPEWQKAFETARWSYQLQTTSSRAVIALLIPLCVGIFYSARLGLLLAIPFGFVFYWLLAR
jgi:hypothetical protein